MRKRKIPGDRVIVSALVLLLLGGTSISIVSAGQWDAPPRGVAVYVRDFEMSVAPATAPDPPSAAYTNKSKEDLELRSLQVQDHFADTLVENLQKQGYSSSRKQARPGNGILLEGVFSETDKKNRIRRALLGSGSPGTKLTLYVGVFDQKSVSQPLYIEAPVQEPDPNYGPVITLNAYIPMAKYEIEKDIAEEDVRSICARIAADLTALLQRNPAALARANETMGQLLAEGSKSRQHATSQVQPAAKRVGITKALGWHSFRRTFATLLKGGGEDVKTVQELMWQPSSRLTLDVCAQALPPAKWQYI